MRGRLVLAAAVAALVGFGCRRAVPHAGPATPRLPKGDILWFTDPAAAADPALDAGVARIGAAAVLLPAGTLGATPGPGAFVAAPAPLKPLAGAPVVLVVAPAEALAESLAATDGPEGGALAASCAAALSRAIQSGAYGRVSGVHLDFPFAPRSAARYAAFVATLRKGLPGGTFVSISLKALPAGEEDRKKTAPLLQAADALVAVVFGVGARLDPIATDALKRPWWAAYDTRLSGSVAGAAGEPRGSVPERLVEPLSGNSKFDFENDLSVNDGSVSAFTLTARSPVRQGELALQTGDRVSFHLPAISEMLFQLGSNLAGKRYALGRAILFGGASDGERLFDLAAMEDVLLGRSLAPQLEVAVKPAGRGAVVVELVNRAHHASVASRVDNWVEVDVSPAHPSDVQIGGFDRYEVYDRAGHPVTPGRATVVRLFETLLGPLETVTAARIVVRGSLPADCCPHRTHALAAAGPEVATDWTAPPPPTPAPKPEARASGPKRKRG